MEHEWRQFLIPLDGTAEGEAALGAIDLFLRSGPVQATVLYVCEGQGADNPGRIYLTRIQERLIAKGVEAETSFREGDPVREILAFCRDHPVDVIAMSPHRHKALMRLLAGSVTEQVARKSEVPVLSCRPGMSGLIGNRILVALDGTELSEEILPFAASLARRLGTGIDLLRVAVPHVAAGESGWVPLYTTSEDPLPYLKSVCGRLEAEGVEAHPVAATGYVAAEVLRHAHETGAGLICLATHARTGWARLAAGSVAVEVMRKASCPVFVHRIPAARPVLKPVER